MLDSQVEARDHALAQPGDEMWVTQVGPPDFSWTEDRAKTKVGLVPPKGGTVFRIVGSCRPTRRSRAWTSTPMMKVVGDHAPAKGLPPRHPMMHRTRRLDYAIIMSGRDRHGCSTRARCI